jgi:hypothetical protein
MLVTRAQVKCQSLLLQFSFWNVPGEAATIAKRIPRLEMTRLGQVGKSHIGSFSPNGGVNEARHGGGFHCYCTLRNLLTYHVFENLQQE